MLEIGLLEISYHVNNIEFPSSFYFRSTCMEAHGMHIAQHEKSLRYRADLLWYIEQDISDVYYYLYWARRYLLYLYKNDGLKIYSVTYAFNPKKSIIQTLRNTIAFIIEIEHKLPFAKEIMPNIHCARKMMNKFESHKHYLPRLSSNKDKHLIVNILLYIQHVYTLVYNVHENALKALDDYEYEYRDSMPRWDLLAKDAYKNRFKPNVLRLK